VNILSGFYNTIKTNHFANAPVNTLEQATEDFKVNVKAHLELKREEPEDL